MRITHSIVFFCLTIVVINLITSCNHQEQNFESNAVFLPFYENKWTVDQNDSNRWDIYELSEKRTLKSYENRHKHNLDGLRITFYPGGGLKRITNYKNHRLHGPMHTFYPSGNLKSIRYFERDSMKGYQIDYFDRPAYIKAKFVISPFSERGFIYKQFYDSNSQKVDSVMDHRSIDIKEHPELSKEELTFPWEKIKSE